jgi:hypothetical protein
MTMLVAAGVTAMAGVGVSGQGGATVKLTKAALAAEVKTDERRMIVPADGQKFLWVSTTLSAATTVDLTKVSVTSGAASFPLIGVDSAFDGDPSAFSMIAKSKLKDGGRIVDPTEETRSEGTVAFAFTPGKLATVKSIKPPVSVCLLFSVPQAFTKGEIKGLSALPIAVPPLT